MRRRTLASSSHLTTKLVAAVLAATLLLNACAGQNADEEQLEQAAANITRHPALSAGSVAVGDQHMHYHSIGTPQLAVVVWIHGTPGGWSDIRRLMADATFTNQVRVVSVDRPGWGLSANTAENAHFRWGDFETHSKLFTPLLVQLRDKHPSVPIIIAGHSWGGSLAPTIAADHVDLVSGVLVAAGGLDPELGAPRWYNRFASTWLVNKLIGLNLRQSNLEVYALQPQLVEQAPRLATLPMPVLVMHGEDDRLVSPRHADFAERRFNPTRTRVVRLPDQGHFLQIQQTKLIGRCLIALATNRLADCQAPSASNN